MLETLHYFRYDCDEGLLLYEVEHFAELLLKNGDTRVIPSFLVEEVDEVLIELQDSMTPVDHVLSADVNLIFSQFYDFEAKLGHVFRLLVSEGDVALDQVLKVHSVSGFSH